MRRRDLPIQAIEVVITRRQDDVPLIEPLESSPGFESQKHPPSVTIYQRKTGLGPKDGQSVTSRLQGSIKIKARHGHVVAILLPVPHVVRDQKLPPVA